MFNYRPIHFRTQSIEEIYSKLTTEYNFFVLFIVSVDINECLEQSVCHSKAQCINKSPGFECKCAKGYIGDGKTCLSQGNTHLAK